MSKTYIKFLEPLEEELSKKISKKGLTITISGNSGSGKSLAARAIAKEFDLRHVKAGEILREFADQKGISIVEMSKIRDPEVDYKMDKRTLKYAMEGNVVLDARLSGWVAGDWADVKIFFECPLDVRAKRVSKRDKISVKQARKNLKKRDEQDHEKYQKLYNIDSFDTSIYNTIINNEKLKKEEAKNIVVEIIKKFLENRQK